MASATDAISVPDLLKLAKTALDAGSVGRLVNALSAQLYEGSKTATFALIRFGELEELLFDPEFVETVGREKLKSKKLISLAFETGQSFSDIVRKLTNMITAEAINMFSSSAIAALHRGMHYNAHTQQLTAKTLLVAKLTGELNTYATAGLFLQLFLQSPDSTLDGDDVLPLVRAVLKDADVRDLSGERADLVSALPDDVADEVRDDFVHANAGDITDDSDADEEGNLRDFIVGDEHESVDSNAGDVDDVDEEDEGSGSDSGSGSGSSGSGSGSEDSDSDSDSGSACKPAVRESASAQQPKLHGRLRRKVSVASSEGGAGAGGASFQRQPQAQAQAKQASSHHKQHNAPMLSAFDELAGMALPEERQQSGGGGMSRVVHDDDDDDDDDLGEGAKTQVEVQEDVEEISDSSSGEEEEDANVRYLQRAQGSGKAAPAPAASRVPAGPTGAGTRKPRQQQGNKAAVSAVAKKRARYIDDMANG